MLDRRQRRLMLAAMSAALVSAPAGAQSPEARLDAIVAGNVAVHAGVGVTAPIGTYLRSGVVAAAGYGADGPSGRFDVFNRFHLDPFRESRWAPYAGGGLSARFDADRKSRVYLLLLVGVDGPERGGLTTSLEAGLGGGGRIGAVIRRTRGERRR